MVSALIVPGSHLISHQISYLITAGRAGLHIYLYPPVTSLSFPYLWHTTSPSSGTPECITRSPAVFVVSSPWSLSPKHKSNSDTAELRGLSSLIGSQIISSVIFSLLTLRIPLEILPFHPQNIFSEPMQQSEDELENGEETNVGPTCVRACVRLMFTTDSYCAFYKWEVRLFVPAHLSYSKIVFEPSLIR